MHWTWMQLGPDETWLHHSKQYCSMQGTDQYIVPGWGERVRSRFSRAGRPALPVSGWVVAAYGATGRAGLAPGRAGRPGRD